jgi:hypothetical protein
MDDVNRQNPVNFKVLKNTSRYVLATCIGCLVIHAGANKILTLANP